MTADDRLRRNLGLISLVEGKVRATSSKKPVLLSTTLLAGMAFAGVRAPDGTLLRDCGPGELVTLTRTDQHAEIVFAGGAGYGNPEARAREDVARDL